ncbi:predicted protein [Aspergillus nidulans FGSC A4]|uniref:Uncharacterized protein n=1 Tax=Emericella nidulans (strain FGSC A4 / ATCC 38163 / CBS 112.46 / NRRL 194 / M139) TaxID=227321 RepID=Q5B7S0_EMENI|nr:hypothetical protein [Aspergillus nidulans FGSC A4]EAA63378.1 predicted protein [Aspergillus nidulans FGSC A4]CBF82764.1 TPA: conserved hypothetical protein [Aspergillus nidulans FGSC A4]|eukprot:XP_661014.1 predicted protein [Aspergillus nidulans FGSC A4]
MVQQKVHQDIPQLLRKGLVGVGCWNSMTLLRESEMASTLVFRRPEVRAHDQSLHTRFPFNIGPEQAQTFRAPSVVTTVVNPEEAVEAVPQRRSRRFSMSDALNQSANSTTARSGSTLYPPSRVLELGLSRRSRSRSRSNIRARSSSVTADVRRSSSMIRSTFNRLSGRRKTKDEEKEDIDEIETELDELDLLPNEPRKAIPVFTPDQATPPNPLMEFRGGALWGALLKDRRTLGLDVFWSVPSEQPTQTDTNVLEEKHKTGPPAEGENKDDHEEPSVLPIDEMAPLCTFRNLRILKITGMMQSYQMYIFQAAWLNTDLEELEIGMALQPRLRRGYKWPYIKGGWRLNKTTYAEPVYHGTGYGTLLRTVGVAEYLDKMCIEKAKIRAMASGSTRNRLSIRTLILTGVVVDADPFLHWFDPKRLKCINFKDNCVDAGFYLSHCMKNVSVLYPKKIREPILTGRRVDLCRELKVVRIKGERKVKKIEYRDVETLRDAEEDEDDRRNG